MRSKRSGQMMGSFPMQAVPGTLALVEEKAKDYIDDTPIDQCHVRNPWFSGGSGFRTIPGGACSEACVMWVSGSWGCQGLRF